MRSEGKSYAIEAVGGLVSVITKTQEHKGSILELPTPVEKQFMSFTPDYARRFAQGVLEAAEAAEY